jgi:heavy metal efflux system protein
MMLNFIVEFSLRQRIMVSLAAIILSILGFFAYQSLPIDAFPDVSSTQVKIIIKSPGYDARRGRVAHHRAD